MRPSPSLTAIPTKNRHFRMGASPFPYGTTLTQVNQSYTTANSIGDMYVVQLDGACPWYEAFHSVTYPSSVTTKWAEYTTNRPGDGRPLYLSLTPVGSDRVAIAPAPSDGQARPATITGSPWNNTDTVTAYLNYAHTACTYFSPTYVNLGVEAGESLWRSPSTWTDFVGFLSNVISGLRGFFPSLKIGISFGLQSLVQSGVWTPANTLISVCDYVGISFYPYQSPFHEIYGLTALPSVPDQWRTPLATLKGLTTKPIAICETGYNTQNYAFTALGINLVGSVAAQQQYVSELLQIATRDQYLFVIYYFPIDINIFVDAQAGDQSATNMWRYNGMLDSSLASKSALAAWTAQRNRSFA